MTGLFLISFIVGLILTNILINFFAHQNLRQFILKDSPTSHMAKEGTPTMGGVAIILSIMITVLFNRYLLDFNVIIVLFLLVSFGIIGMWDDLTKISKKHNRGLRAITKLILQVSIACAFTGFLASAGVFNEVMGFLSILPPFGYYLLVIFMIVGTSNAVNLTDGLDGLATGNLIIALIGFAFLAYLETNFHLLLFSLVVIGVLLAFLWFNLNPARIFMGDTGSLALGAMLAGIAVVMHKEIMLILLGIIFVIETLSVILQVTYFKITGGKRIFKMSPIHHHFELCGWSETKVVTRFWIIGIIALVVALQIG